MCAVLSKYSRNPCLLERFFYKDSALSLLESSYPTTADCFLQHFFFEAG